MQWWVLTAAFVTLPLAAFPAAAARLTSETPSLSSGGEAAGFPAMTSDTRPGPWYVPLPAARTPLPAGVVGPSFTGFGYDDNFTENGFRTIPPDPSGAAGPNRLVAAVSSMIEARDRTGVLLFRDALKDFYAPLAGCAVLTGPFDPKVVYDSYAGRFLVMALERAEAGVNPSVNNKSRILIAVSKTSSPATATAADWWYTCLDSKVTLAGTEYWADFPGFEVDEEAIYVTVNLFTFTGVASTFGGSRLWILPKGTSGGFYAGGPATSTVRDPYVLAGSIATTTVPAQVYGANGVGPGIGTFLVSYSGITDGSVEYMQVIRVDDPLGGAGGPFFVGPDLVSLNDVEQLNGALPDAPQPGTAQLIEVNDRRALDAVWRNGGLWVTTTVNPDGLPAAADHTTAWWVKLNTSAVVNSASPAGLITFDQQGAIQGEEIAGGAGGPVYTYYPSVAVNASGTAAFGFCASGPNVYAGAYATLRRASDPFEATDSASEVRAGRDYYVRTLDGPPCDPTPARNRWGDYSAISLDPTNDDAFWVFNEFADFRGSPSTGGCNGRPDPEDGRWSTAWSQVGLKPRLTIGNAAAAEGNSGTVPLVFTVHVSPPSVTGLSVNYAAVNGTATTANADYVATSGTLSIPAGVASSTLTVLVNGDVAVEPNETFSVALSNPVNATVVAGGGIGTIYNDDGATSVPGSGPGELALRTLTPNPGAAPPRLEFDLPDEGPVSLAVLDVRGHRVAQLAEGRYPAGRHIADWDAGVASRRLARGVYFARLATPAGVRTLRIVLL